MADGGGNNDHSPGNRSTSTDLTTNSFLKRNFELFLWTVFASALSFEFFRNLTISFMLAQNWSQIFTRIQYTVAEYTGSLLISAFVIGFPLVFKRTFNEFPFEALRSRLEPRTGTVIQLSEISAQGNIVVSTGERETPDALSNDTIIRYIDALDPRQTMTQYAEQSNKIAENIYSRAGVHLILGVSIAFVGIAFAYVRLNNPPDTKDPLEHFLLLLPGFGIVFFIEFVALFFLRQYRSGMDEFRYYDAVTRGRQENVVVLKMFKESTLDVPTKDVLGSMSIYSTAGKLLPGETSDILESRKMQRDELVFMETIAAAFAKYKDNEKDKKDQKS